MRRNIGIAVVLLGILAIVGGFLLKKNQENGQSKKTASNDSVYTHPTLGFQIIYPTELKVEDQKEEEFETIVFYDPNNESASKVPDKVGFQIFITPFEGEGPLTRERILEDLPEATIEEPLQVIVNPSAPPEERIEGLVFWSENPDIGRTRELWFIHENHLYEVTTYAHLDTWLAKLMDSLRFQKVLE